MKNQVLAKPPKMNLIKELRAVKDIATMPGHLLLAEFSKRRQTAKRTPVLLIPGIGGSDRVMAPFRRYLESAGYRCFGWGMGTNLAGLDLTFNPSELSWNVDPLFKNNGELGVPYLCDRMVERARKISQDVGRPIAIVGWSLGGTIAREVARDIPEHVNCVVTLGTPVQGGPKYTATSERLAKRGLDMDWIERAGHERDKKPISRPITAIASESDGVVGYSATRDKVSLRVKHVDTNLAHMGMVFNKRAWDITLEALAEQESELH